MKKMIPFETYIKNVDRQRAVRALGVTSGALSQWLSSGREIYVAKRDGKLIAIEHKIISRSTDTTQG